MPAKSIAAPAKAKSRKAPPKRNPAARPKEVFSVRLNVEDVLGLENEAKALGIGVRELAVARLLNKQAMGGFDTSELASKKDFLQLDERMGRIESFLMKAIGLSSDK